MKDSLTANEEIPEAVRRYLEMTLLWQRHPNMNEKGEIEIRYVAPKNKEKKEQDNG